MIFTTDMSYANHILEPDPIQQAEDAQLYRYVLHKLLHLGTDLIHILQAQATAHAHAAMQEPTPPKPSTDQAIAFDRIARTIRRTITLARSLNEPVAPARAPAHPRAAAATSALHEAADAAAGQDAAGHPAGTPGRDAANAESSSAGLRDRPEATDHDAPDRDPPDRDGPDRDEDDTGRSPAAVIAGICRDLGLDTPPGIHPATRRTPADTAQPHAQAAAPSSATASTPCQPGPAPQGPGPWLQRPGHDAAQQVPGPQPDQHDPDGPAAANRAQPIPAQSSGTLPDDPAQANAMVLQHAARVQDARWRPLPAG